MMKLNGVIILLAVFFCTVVIGVSISSHDEAVEAISCDEVKLKLAPCLGYLTMGGKPSFGCCNGVKALNDEAKTTPDIQSACRCLKSLFEIVPGINPKNAEQLPGRCDVNVPYPIKLDTDCSKLQ